VDYSQTLNSKGDIKSFTASVTGPNPTFEIDVHVELSPFDGPGKGPSSIEFQEPPKNFWLNVLSLWKIGVAPKVKGAIATAKDPAGGKAVHAETRRLTPDKQGKLGDFEKATVATHVLKLSHAGIHHMIFKKRAQMSLLALLGYSLGAVLLVVLAVGACRSFLRQKKGYVAPEEHDEETQALREDQLPVLSE
jgi:hypothetical protein